MLLFVLVAVALTWMHFTIRHLERREHPELAAPRYLPELSGSTAAGKS
jgi:NNP family nitrate/nitrite transporter-like MFS transporter